MKGELEDRPRKQISFINFQYGNFLHRFYFVSHWCYQPFIFYKPTLRTVCCLFDLFLSKNNIVVDKGWKIELGKSLCKVRQSWEN